MSSANRKLVFLAASFVAVVAVVVIAFVAVGTQRDASDAGSEQLAALEQRKAELDSKDSLTNDEEREYDELVEKVGRAQVENGTFDYKEEVELRVNAIEAVVDDAQRIIDSGSASKKERKAAKRSKRLLEPVVEKYRALLENDDGTTDYKSVSENFEAEMYGESGKLALAG